jgi:hypothetical protein
MNTNEQSGKLKVESEKRGQREYIAEHGTEYRAESVMLVDVRRAANELRFAKQVLEHATRATNEARKLIGALTVLADQPQFAVLYKLHNEILQFGNWISNAAVAMPDVGSIEQELRATFKFPLQVVSVEKIRSEFGAQVRTDKHGPNHKSEVRSQKSAQAA